MPRSTRNLPLSQSMSDHFKANCAMMRVFPMSGFPSRAPERKYKLRRAYLILLFLSKSFCYRRSRKGREVLRCKPHSQDNNGWKRFRFDKEEPESCSAKLQRNSSDQDISTLCLRSAANPRLGAKPVNR